MKSGGLQKAGTSVKALMPKPTRRRITFRFQLDMARDNVEFFSNLQQWLAAKKSWKRYAMEGLRLFYDLSNGSTAVLLELFPNIREMLGQGDDDGGLRDEIAELRRLILESREIPPPPMDYPTMKPALNAPKAVITQAAAMSANDIADNFLSMFD
jgi:hypothetical protein